MRQPEVLAAYLKMAPVVPVLVVRQVADAVPLATALVEGGLPALEVTLRTPAVLEAIREMSAVPGCVVGAGTVLDARQAEQAVKAGAQFLVSPGSTPELLDAVEELGVPFLPGVATASEAMAARDRGLRILKFFPSGQAGGPAYLKALASPLAELQFCPTGGVTADNATSYLKLPNVICVGGSWIAPQELVDAKRWSAIRELANAAANL